MFGRKTGKKHEKFWQRIFLFDMKHIQWQCDSFLSSKTCLKFLHHWLVQNVFAAAWQCIVNRQSLRYWLWALEGFFVWKIPISLPHLYIYILCFKQLWRFEMYPIHNTTIFKKWNIKMLSIKVFIRSHSWWKLVMTILELSSERNLGKRWKEK